MKEDFCKRNSGISLVMLIITVIIMVIIAGVIVVFSGKGELLDSAQDVVNKTEEQAEQQEQMVNDVRSLYR